MGGKITWKVGGCDNKLYIGYFLTCDRTVCIMVGGLKIYLKKSRNIKKNYYMKNFTISGVNFDRNWWLALIGFVLKRNLRNSAQSSEDTNPVATVNCIFF